MRTLIATTTAVLFLGLTACATPATGDPDDIRRLADDCAARGGILTPSGQQTGRARIDNVCRITGGATRITTGD
ncbi:MAG: hypothetical protein Q8R45_07760 [Brevundimonas sp.]|uniref:hypothetical protein n=1 Tax=Brevundimonas sp. TaxID=1871086 RepID=UPI0027164DB3|nr:hypothetical protein [Brevundimonas sp.]MDO9588510.1 hypothetical protein [Brevundimonas sp.]MDP3369345.1 hypothetical protein [Brevundimonas sp.]MDP3656842.1 hypothetical protein [Brevundimonas sp.]MDZ4110082.1 hypothetical protein [Brevundimonas sp.]